ncbi:MAG TPA: Holliday junction branch migration DNA helicase RuvB [Candidatus Paceibacterota bacterium]|jgi:Holliday junction DNA helicase RuvB|nr:Holliday junction branch migration DNA helicase RuvB [Candidatus Paceibacterota bacterium]HRS47873.1 Holliday junction branch migration DNA helicase RuvB [Candidatus Paceibacterota bacterium]
MNKNQENKKEDLILDNMLRPKRWDEFIGQEKIKKSLKMMLESALKRNDVLDHLLFFGPSGVGKTTLAYLIANELNSPIVVSSGPAIQKLGDLAAILTNLEEKQILFIDEIHRLNKKIEEVLYPALEQRKLNLIIGKGVSSRTLEFQLPKFTLIAATTKPNLLSNPLRNRFGLMGHLDFYEISEIEQIIQRSAKILNIEITSGGIKTIAQASRAIPRIANRLLKRAWDLQIVQNKTVIDEKLALETLEVLNLDRYGLEELDRNVLKTLAYKFNGGPVGIETLAISLNEDKETLETLSEPYLIRLGFIERTNKGRIATKAAFDYLKNI